MSSEAGFLDAILDDPSDLTTRLIFADWLEDRGDPRGEFMRVQTELAGWVPDLARRTKLLHRQEQLLAQYENDWLGPLCPLVKRWYWEGGLLHVTLFGYQFETVEDPTLCREWFARAWTGSVQLEGMSEFFESHPMFEALQDVRALSVSGDELNDAWFEHYLQASWMKKVLRLDLSNNRLTDRSAATLIQSPLLERLTWLDLRNNQLTELGIRSLMDALAARRLRWFDVTLHDPNLELCEDLEKWRRQRGAGTERILNSLGMELTRIPTGSFLMGSPETEAQRYPDESPQHPVTISRPFYLGTYPVTQLDYHRVMEHNPSAFSSGESYLRRPVERVSWEDAVEFCRRLTDLPAEQAAGRAYRLPSEAEWEHACRAGTDTPFPHPYYHSLSSHFANFDGTRPHGSAPEGPYLNRTSPVGTYPPNGFGLFDMMGNTWEWCADGRVENFYANSPAVDPVAPLEDDHRMCRGASWASPAHYLRSADRGSDRLNVHDSYYGFRVACDLL